MNDRRSTEVLDEKATSVLVGESGDDALTPSEAMILEALERLVGVTDDVAHRLIANLDEMKEDFQQDWRGTRGELKKLQESRSEELTSAVDQVRSAVETSEESSRAREQGVRTTLAEGLDGILEQIDRRLQSQSGKSQDRLEKLSDQLEEQLGGIQERMESLTSSIEERIADLVTRIDSSLEALAAEQTAKSDIVHDQMTQLHESLEQAQQAMREGLEARLDNVRDDLRKSMQEAGAALREEMESARKADEDRASRVEAASAELRTLGAQMQESTGALQKFFEDEEDRSRQAAESAEREEARRLNNAGVSRFHAGEFAQAAELFEQAVDKDKRFAEAYNNLGLAYTEMERHDDATVSFETAIELNPDLGAGYNNLGYVLYRQENYEAAIEMYKEAIGRSHDTSAAYTNLGNAYQKLDQVQKAVASWEMALQADPGNERARRYLDRYTGGIATGGNGPTDDSPAN